MTDQYCKSLGLTADVTARVVQLHRDGSKKAKGRVLVVAHGAGDGQVLLFNADHGPNPKPARQWALRDLRAGSVATSGSTGAVLSFGGGGADGNLAVTFESALQRDVCLTALKKHGGDPEGRGSWGQEPAGRQGMQRGGAHFGSVAALDEFAKDGQAEAGTDLAAPAGTTGGALLARRDELVLLRAVAAGDLDLADIGASEKALTGRLATLERTAVTVAIEGHAEWQECSRRILGLRDDVELLQARVNRYAAELLSRRTIIERIEVESTRRQRRMRNAEAAAARIQTLLDALSLPPRAEAAVTALEAWSADAPRDRNDICAFFSRDDDVAAAAAAVVHITDLLESLAKDRADAKRAAKLRRQGAGPVGGPDDHDSDDGVPVTKTRGFGRLRAVRERADILREARDGIARKAGVALSRALQQSLQRLLEASGHRVAKEGRLVLLPPTSVFDVVARFAPLLPALRAADYTQFMRLVRQYTAGMRRLHSREINRFFLELRRQCKRLGWRDTMNIGDRRVAATQSLQRLAEDGELTPTPLFHFDTPLSEVRPGPLAAASPAPLGPALASAARRRDQEEGRGCLEVVLHPADESGIRLLRPEVTYTAAADRGSVVEKWAGHSTGALRPDLAFAAAFKATTDLVLMHRDVLKRCFCLPSGFGTGGDAAQPDADSDQSDHGGGDATNVTQYNELDTALWEALTDERCTAMQEPTLLHRRLEEFLEFLTEEGDGLYFFPISAMVEAVAAADSGTRSGDMLLTGGSFSTDRGRGSVSGLATVSSDSGAIPASGATVGLRATLKMLRTLIRHALHVYAARQAESIDRSSKEAATDAGLLPCFLAFPVTLQRLDSLLSGTLEHPTCDDAAQFVADIAERLFRALDAATMPVGFQRGGRLGLGSAAAHLGVAAANIGVPLAAEGADVPPHMHPSLRQYLHHLFFGLALERSGLTPAALQWLQEERQHSRTLCDRYRAAWLVRVVLPKAFPVLMPYIALAAEVESSAVANNADNAGEELRMHAVLKLDRMRAVNEALPQEIRNGPETALRFLRRAVARALPGSDAAVVDSGQELTNMNALHGRALEELTREARDVAVDKVEAFLGLLTRCHPAEMPKASSNDVARNFRAAQDHPLRSGCFA